MTDLLIIIAAAIVKPVKAHVPHASLVSRCKVSGSSRSTHLHTSPLGSPQNRVGFRGGKRSWKRRRPSASSVVEPLTPALTGGTPAFEGPGHGGTVIYQVKMRIAQSYLLFPKNHRLFGSYPCPCFGCGRPDTPGVLDKGVSPIYVTWVIWLTVIVSHE